MTLKHHRTLSTGLLLAVASLLLPMTAHAEPPASVPVEVLLGAPVHAAAACTVACIAPDGATSALLGRDVHGVRLSSFPADPDPVVYPMSPDATGTGFNAVHGVTVGETVTFAVHSTDSQGRPRIGYLRRDPDGRYYLTPRFTRAEWFSVGAAVTLDASNYVEITEYKDRRKVVARTRRAPGSLCPAWREKMAVRPDHGGTHVFLQLQRKNGSWVTMTRQTTRADGSFDFTRWSTRSIRQYKTRQYDIPRARTLTKMQRVFIPGNAVLEPTQLICQVTYGG